MKPCGRTLTDRIAGEGDRRVVAGDARPPGRSRGAARRCRSARRPRRRRRGRRRDSPRASGSCRRRRSSAPSTSAESPIRASCSRKRVRIVRRSWLTPASIAVRCSICRSTRSRMSWKATRRLAHLARAARREVGHRAALAEIVDGGGQRQDRPDLVAQEEDGDGEQHEAGADHPDDEDQRVGGVGLAAAGEDAQHVVVELDADLDQVASGRPCRSRTACRSAG